MLVSFISFILGFFVAFFVFALNRASDDTIDKIIMLQDNWKKFKNNQVDLKTIEKQIMELL